MTGTEKNLQSSIKVALDAGYGGFSWLGVGLDESNPGELQSVFFGIERFLKLPVEERTFEKFEQSINPSQAGLVEELVQQLVRFTSFDLNRYGQFASKLLDRLTTTEALPCELSRDDGRALAHFITRLAEFERCRSTLSHTTLNYLRQGMRLVYETKMMPDDYPFHNDPDCVRRLMAFVQEDGSESNLFSDSKTMIAEAELISQSTVIQDVVSKIQGDALGDGEISISFFDEKSLSQTKVGWEKLKDALEAFPMYNGENDLEWLADVDPGSLESAKMLAEEYQKSLARPNFYEKKK